MLVFSLAPTFLIVSLFQITRSTSIVRAPLQHHEIAARLAQSADMSANLLSPSKRNPRRSCKTPSSLPSHVQPSFSAASSTIHTYTLVTKTTSSAPSVTQSSATTTIAGTPPSEQTAPEQKPILVSTSSATSTATVSSGTISSSVTVDGHAFTLTNKCSNAVHPVIASTACGYSPRCADAFSGSLPSIGSLGAGQTKTVHVPKNFVGRIFSQNGSCGSSGEKCTMLEFNLDANSLYTPNSYDISNIQGFTQSISLGAAGCDTVTCTGPQCDCHDAYPIGDMTGCGADLPVRACGAGDIAFEVVFCP
ncbi:unnamed protein product [Mycena citricolor]|uniref:Thaumatin-like protein n=1 Tax=Mycena citricolor TaxID=2018698 RepID=A0AAD2JWB2_9AGAR|nr:unnamed protein product [Mycena citricolor]